ncbi:hypothetical protein CRG98_005868 [Punica granatum]|uniref:Uncharacterized protein n=1 Tax=Punica granatum TaxID=22663 RepID=A0A2I0KZ57_PUNGR|nr:hypothetical protein CRG98_005868 [Punica granatum]
MKDCKGISDESLIIDRSTYFFELIGQLSLVKIGLHVFEVLKLDTGKLHLNVECMRATTLNKHAIQPFRDLSSRRFVMFGAETVLVGSAVAEGVGLGVGLGGVWLDWRSLVLEWSDLLAMVTA